MPPETAATRARRTVPEGAARMSRMWVDDRGRPQVTAYEVPVDDADRRTAHQRRVCRGKEEVAGVVQPCSVVDWSLPGAPTRFCPGHGAPLAVSDQDKAEFPARKVWNRIKERAYVAAGIVAVGGTGGLAEAVDLPWWGTAAQIAAMPAVVASSGPLASWWLTRRDIANNRPDPGDQVGGKRRRNTIARRARCVTYSTIGGTGWVAVADLLGLDLTSASGWSLLGLLVGGGIIATRPYLRWIDSQQRKAPERPAPEPDDEEIPAGAQEALDWAEHVAVTGVLPNTQLVAGSWRQVTGGWGMLIRGTKPGAISIDTILDAAAKAKRLTIAQTYKVKPKALNFVEENDPNVVLMLVQPKPPLADVRLWLGPESITVTESSITAVTGRKVDGSQMVEPFFKRGWGAPSKIVLGTTGSGKSEAIRKQLIIQRWAHYTDGKGNKHGLFATFLHDFKRYESYSEFRRNVHAAGCTVEDAWIMLEALIREMDRRYDMLAGHTWVDRRKREREGGIKFNPRIHGPVLGWVIDEFHEIANDTKFVAKLELLARKMRACGIYVVIGTHLATLSDTGSRGLRDMLSGGYAILGRTTDGLTSVITGGTLTLDPRQLPKVPGYCLVADGEERTMEARQDWIPNDEEAEALGDDVWSCYDWMRNADNNPIGYPAVLPPETLAAFGDDWVEWAEAGKQPGGREASGWKARKSAVPPPTVGEGEKSAEEAIVKVLWAVKEPLDIDGIDAGLAPFRKAGGKCSTRTARAILKKLIDAKDGPVCRSKHGFYALKDAYREEVKARAVEALGEAFEDAEVDMDNMEPQGAVQ